MEKWSLQKLQSLYKRGDMMLGGAADSEESTTRAGTLLRLAMLSCLESLASLGTPSYPATSNQQDAEMQTPDLRPTAPTPRNNSAIRTLLELMTTWLSPFGKGLSPQTPSPSLGASCPRNTSLYFSHPEVAQLTQVDRTTHTNALFAN